MIFPLFRSAFEVNKRSFEQVQQERDLNHGSLPSELVDLLICMGHKPVLKPGDIARSITSDITMGEGRCRLAHFFRGRQRIQFYGRNHSFGGNMQ